MARFLALLRGINVGGRNSIRMADLRTCFEGAGLGDVATYIQSGNVVFTAAEKPGELTPRIEAVIAATFGIPVSVLLRTHAEMKNIVRRAPSGFGGDPETYRYDVIFLMPPLAAAQTLNEVPTKEGVDEVHGGPGVLYFSRLIARASSSQLSRVVSMPIYKSMTIRNWNTTTRLLALMNDGAIGSAGVYRKRS